MASGRIKLTMRGPHFHQGHVTEAALLDHVEKRHCHCGPNGIGIVMGGVAGHRQCLGPAGHQSTRHVSQNRAGIFALALK